MVSHARLPRGSGARTESPLCGAASVGEQVAEAQRVHQLQQRYHVPRVGPHSLIPLAPYRVGFRSETAVHLGPRKPRLLLETHEALQEVVREVAGSSAVVCALSRHGPPLWIPAFAGWRSRVIGQAQCSMRGKASGCSGSRTTMSWTLSPSTSMRVASSRTVVMLPAPSYQPTKLHSPLTA